MNSRNVRRGTKRIEPERSPELEKRLKEFHEGIGKALAANLNRNVMAKSEGDEQRKASNSRLQTG
jgi:hypothetical protein